MKEINKYFLWVMLLLLPQALLAEVDVKARAEIEVLKKQVQDLTKLLTEHVKTKQEVKKLRTILASRPVEKQDVKKLVVAHKKTKEEVTTLLAKQEDTEKKLKHLEKNAWNMGNSSVHLAGYGSAGYEAQHTKGSRFNLVQFSPIFHYMYKDLVMLESELEFEVSNTGATNVGLEYLTIDLFLHDYVTVIAGKFLSPLGQFRQNYHPTWINKLPSAPVGFGHDQAAPVSDVGLQVRGGVPYSDDGRFNYALYISNGPGIELNGAGDTIDRIESNGSTKAADGRMVCGGRVGIVPLPRLEIAVSGAIGTIAMSTPEPNRGYAAYGIDFRYAYKKLDLRGEYSRQRVDHAYASVAPRAFNVYAWYLQAAYKLPYKFEAVVRYSDFHSFNEAKDQGQWACGLNYLYTSNIIVKLAYEANRGRHTKIVNKDRYLVQLAFGF